jgi:hypothetical protein
MTSLKDKGQGEGQQHHLGLEGHDCSIQVKAKLHICSLLLANHNGVKSFLREHSDFNAHAAI